MEHLSAKYGLYGAILAAVITGAVALYIHFDEKSEQEIAEELERKADQAKDTANLTISDVYLPPINTSIDSSFFAEVSNNSMNVAKELKVTIDFGEAVVSKCETLPSNYLDAQQDFQSSMVVFSVESMEKKERLYIYCLISHPVFNSIFITGSNLFSNERFTYENYTAVKRDAPSGFVTFFKVIASIVAVIFIGYFTVVTIELLNKWFGMNSK